MLLIRPPGANEEKEAQSDENRLRLLMRLQEAPCHVSQPSEELGMTQASVSKHLAVLKQAGLVRAHRHGQQAIHEINDESITELCEVVCDGVVQQLARATCRGRFGQFERKIDVDAIASSAKQN